MRLSFFELLMLAALLGLVVFFVEPRIAQGFPEVRASQAAALQLHLEALYARWQNAGGVHGRGEPDHLRLTRNLLSCFTSRANAPFASAVVAQNNFGLSGVYEKPSLFPNPSELRLSELQGACLAEDKKTVLMAGEFEVLFDGEKWSVSAK